TYVFRWVVSNGVCSSDSADVTITVAPPTNPGVVGPDRVVCSGINTGTLNLTGYDGTILYWQDSTVNSTWTQIPGTANLVNYTFNNLT
ncbi:hypothetical protein, partial [Stenotrophomonas maltophilia]|uniref:hypothetical protein n=1 Tax=Stenotrophomonas maltophilia TaxID=40324 RepID=UPI00195462E4